MTLCNLFYIKRNFIINSHNKFFDLIVHKFNYTKLNLVNNIIVFKYERYMHERPVWRIEYILRWKIGLS